MQRRIIREIINNNPHELQFSRMKGLEIENGEAKEIDEELDHFYNIQMDIIEELIMRKDSYHYVQNLQQKTYMKNTSFKSPPKR